MSEDEFKGWPARLEAPTDLGGKSEHERDERNEKSEVTDCSVNPELAEPNLRPGSVHIIPAKNLTPKPVAWVWPDWLAAGKFHLLAGPAGTGKTTLALAMAATITCGRFWPDDAPAIAGSVLFWSGEDDISDSLLPRFLANGGDAGRLSFVAGTQGTNGKIRSFNPAQDMAALIEAARNISDLALVVIDPIVMAVASDSHKNTEVRRDLQPLVNLAARTGAAVLGITHFSKGTSGRHPLERVTGSLAFGALPRLVMATSRPDEANAPPRLVRAKSNIGPDGGGFEYELRQVPLPGHEGVSGQAVIWGRRLEGTARALLAEIESSDSERSAPGRSEAKAWLLDRLAAGPVDVALLKTEAADKGHAWRTVERAKTALSVQAVKIGIFDGWVWQLGQLDPEDRHTR